MANIELLDFFAEWCGPCHHMKPILEELEKELEGKVTVTQIDVDTNPDKVSQYGVLSMPTYIILKDGKETDRLVGAQTKEILLNKLK